MQHIQNYLKILAFLGVFLLNTFVFSQTTEDCEIINCVINSQFEDKARVANQVLHNRFFEIAKSLKTNEEKSNFHKVDSIKQSGLVSKRIEKLYPVFDLENYNYILSQEKRASTWKLSNCKLTIKDLDKNIKEIYLSKPVYSKDHNVALITIRRNFAYYILTLFKENNIWKEGHIIFFCFWDKKTNDCMKFEM